MSPVSARPLSIREGVDGFVAAAEELARVRRGEPLFAQTLRRDALAAFDRLGFPSTRHEEWRYTNVAPLARTPFVSTLPPGMRERTAALSVEKVLLPLGFSGAEGIQLVFLNGHFVGDWSSMATLPRGITVSSLTEAIREKPDLVEPNLGRYAAFENAAFLALNSALFTDGAFIHVAKGIAVDDPIRLFFLSVGTGDPAMSYPRVLLLLDENAQASVVETYAGDTGSLFVNAVTEAVLGPGAVLEHATLQNEGAETFHIGHLRAEHGLSSQSTLHLFSLGAHLARNEAAAILNGEGAGTTMNGLFVVRGTQHVDNQTLIDHVKPHGTSQELYKGILGGTAHGTFDGKIIVRPNAAKTDAHQKNRNLLLSDGALVDSKPQLEIYNNDVRCTHGSATGRLDADALFYLRSRGLDEAAARILLTAAFAQEVVERSKVETLRACLTGLLGTALS